VTALRGDPSRHEMPQPPQSQAERRLDRPEMTILLESLLHSPLETASCIKLVQLYGPFAPRATPPYGVSFDAFMLAFPPFAG
jgi:hypothetical protein